MRRCSRQSSGAVMSVDQEPQSFMDYWNDVDAALMKHFGIDTSDAGIEPDVLAGVQEEGQTPEATGGRA
jgi:hypothetical protein